jgi:hypothetical protein
MNNLAFLQDFLHPVCCHLAAFCVAGKVIILVLLENLLKSWAPLAHAYNPSYSRGRDQEDDGSKPASAKKFSRPYLKKTHHIGTNGKGVGTRKRGMREYMVNVFYVHI